MCWWSHLSVTSWRGVSDGLAETGGDVAVVFGAHAQAAVCEPDALVAGARLAPSRLTIPPEVWSTGLGPDTYWGIGAGAICPGARFVSRGEQ